MPNKKSDHAKHEAQKKQARNMRKTASVMKKRAKTMRKTTRREDVNQAAARILREATEH
jgi:hypothetical protein